MRVLDFGQHDDAPFLVMELVPGGALARSEREPLLPERAFEIVGQAARGAGAAHAVGLIHRDIKPGNILLDDEGRAKLADFGIASTHTGERMTATGAAIGSPYYIAPERVAGVPATPASDVYSLGIVLYELLAGRRPFEGSNPTAVAISHIDQVPEPPSTHNAALDPGIDAVVLRCLAKDPEERFPDGDALAKVLGAARLGGPLVLAAAAEHSYADPDDEEPVRQPRLLAGSLVTLLLLSLLSVSYFWQKARADRDGKPEVSVEEQGKDEAGGDNDKNKKKADDRSPEEGITAEAEPAVVSSPTPSPSPSDQEQERKSDREPQGGSEAPEQEDEPAPQPTEQPDPEPTQEPEPEPTDEPEPEPSPSPSSSEPEPEPSP